MHGDGTTSRPPYYPLNAATAMIKLHAIAQSGNAYKVALMLRLLKQPFETVHVNLFGGQTRDPAWRAANNELGEVPVLDIDGKHLTQSGAILTYLADKHNTYAGRNVDERQDVLRWLLFDNHKFTGNFAAHRFMRSLGPTAPDPAVMAWLKMRTDGAMGIVEGHLSKQPYVVGDALTIADVSMCGYLFYPAEETGYDIAKTYPAMHAWLQRIQAMPGWAGPYDVLPGERIAPKWVIG
jgi:glutathione S-transferase